MTDVFVKTLLQSLVRATKTVSREDALSDVKRNVRLDISEPDARIRILMHQNSYLELCERLGWEFVEKAPKSAIKHILSALQPPRLKSKIEDALQLDRADLKADIFSFLEFLSDESGKFEEYCP